MSVDANKSSSVNLEGKAWAVQVTRDGKEVSRVLLSREKMFIGRMAQNHIVLDSPAISRSHAVITQTMGKFFIIDQGSQNGTHLNGRLVLQDEFKAGDLLSIGPFVLKLVQTNSESKDQRAAARAGTDGDMTLSEHGMEKPKSKGP